jgi:hypothetical protein
MGTFVRFEDNRAVKVTDIRNLNHCTKCGLSKKELGITS